MHAIHKRSLFKCYNQLFTRSIRNLSQPQQNNVATLYGEVIKTAEMIDKRPFLRYFFLCKPKSMWSAQSNTVEQIGYGTTTKLQQLLLELNGGSELPQPPTLVGPTHKITSILESKLSAQDVSTRDLQEILGHLQDILHLSAAVPPMNRIQSPSPRQRTPRPSESQPNGTVLPPANQQEKPLVDTNKLRVEVLSVIPVFGKSTSDSSVFLLQQPVSMERSVRHRDVIHLFYDKKGDCIMGINWSTAPNAIKIEDITNDKNKCDLQYQGSTGKFIPAVFGEESLHFGGSNSNVLHCVTNCVICDGTTLLNGKLRLDPDLKQAANLIEKGYASIDQFRFFVGLVKMAPEKLENIAQRGLWFPISIYPTEGVPTHVAHREVAKILWNFDGEELWKFLTCSLPNEIGVPLRQAACLLDAPEQCQNVLHKHRNDVEGQISEWRDTR